MWVGEHLAYGSASREGVVQFRLGSGCGASCGVMTSSDEHLDTHNECSEINECNVPLKPTVCFSSTAPECKFAYELFLTPAAKNAYRIAKAVLAYMIPNAFRASCSYVADLD